MRMENEIVKLKNEKHCVNTYLTSDICGLIEIAKDLEKQGYTSKDDIAKMITSTYKITCIFLECQTEKYADGFYTDTEKLYQEMWGKLWNMLNIDINKHWNNGTYIKN